MKIKSLLFTAVLSLTAAINASAQQPLNMCCHPDDIKNWTPGVNADDAFNVAKVPLAKRFQEPTLMKANVNQYYGGEVCNSTILFPTCSLCPSQGANNYTGYQPTYWQYLDKLVYWAGAASEGIINMPPAASTDAAHAQGVKSIGNIFFPPSAYGGDQAWVRQMLTVENGHYIYAQKLYELCKYFNFDGWFINEETGGGSQSEWVGFFKEFYASAAADGNTTVELQWYNASGTPNTDILSTNINTSQFLEYGSVGDHRSYASSNSAAQQPRPCRRSTAVYSAYTAA
jgi:endo-beta-N-acetylglucosaminidase D